MDANVTHIGRNEPVDMSDTFLQLRGGGGDADADDSDGAAPFPYIDPADHLAHIHL